MFYQFVLRQGLSNTDNFDVLDWDETIQAKLDRHKSYIPSRVMDNTVSPTLVYSVMIIIVSVVSVVNVIVEV